MHENNENLMITTVEKEKTASKIKFNYIESCSLMNFLLFTIVLCSIISISINILKINDRNSISESKNISFVNNTLNINTSLIGSWKMVKSDNYTGYKYIEKLFYNEYRPWIEFQRDQNTWFLNCIKEDFFNQYSISIKLRKEFSKEIVDYVTQARFEIIENKLHKIHTINKIEKFKWVFEVIDEETILMSLHVQNIILKTFYKRIIIDHYSERCQKLFLMGINSKK